MLENVISAPCAPLSSIYMSMAQLLAHFSFFLMAPLYIANGWHVVFNPSSPLLGSLVATLVIASALAQLFQQHLVAYQITSPTRLVNGSRYVIYTRTPITTIMGVAGQLTWQVLLACFFFPSCFCRVPQDFGSSGPGLPPALSPSFPLQTGMGSSESPFSLEWGLIAGLRRFASHGGSILFRGWLAIMVAPGYSRHQRST